VAPVVWVSARIGLGVDDIEAKILFEISIHGAVL
jgi:hypothetical protein